MIEIFECFFWGVTGMEKIFHGDKLKLNGFNNLTKVLSFNLYDFCIALNQKEKDDYIQYIHEKYSAARITEIAEEICKQINAEVLGISKQDYDPVGASSMVLMSDYMGGGWSEGSSVKMHLDKSHITAHTYPEAGDPNGICSFRVDIDIATCGEISPLTAVNYLFESFECDVVYIDYVVRGFTRLQDGTKIYNDQYFNSIQDFIKPEILKDYQYKTDLNIPGNMIWQTKLMIGEFGAERYLMEPTKHDPNTLTKEMDLLKSEMFGVFHLS